MIEIIPAIDIIGGRCVRLTRGDYSKQTDYSARPAEMARAFADCGVRRIHLVDLEGAKAGEPCNLRTLESIADALSSSRITLEWGGGLANDSGMKSAFDAGAGNLVIGSVAVLKPDLFSGWLSAYGAEKMVLGADVRAVAGQSALEAKVAVKGWLEDSQVGIEELLDRFPGISQCIVTDINRDGMLQGPNTQLYRELQQARGSVCFTVSGGISGMQDIVALDAAGLRKVIAGKAIYEGRISFKDIEKTMTACSANE